MGFSSIPHVSADAVAAIERSVAVLGDEEFVRLLLTLRLAEAGVQVGQVYDLVQDLKLPIVDGSAYDDRLGVLYGRYANPRGLAPGVLTEEEAYLFDEVCGALLWGLGDSRAELPVDAAESLIGPLFSAEQVFELVTRPEFHPKLAEPVAFNTMDCQRVQIDYHARLQVAMSNAGVPDWDLDGWYYLGDDLLRTCICKGVEVLSYLGLTAYEQFVYVFGLRWDIGPAHRDLWDQLVAMYRMISHDVVKIDAAELLVYVADGSPLWVDKLIDLAVTDTSESMREWVLLLLPVITSQKQWDRIAPLLITPAAKQMAHYATTTLALKLEQQGINTWLPEG